MEYITMQEAWDQIEAIPGYARKKSGIPKIREFLGLLGDPDREFQVIHVAGTNGKGSVCKKGCRQRSSSRAWLR